MREFEYLHHTDLTIVLRALYHGAGDFRPLAGGTDLVPLLKRDIVEPVAVLEISRVAELGGLLQTERSGLMLGPLLTLAELSREPLLSGPYAAVAEAASASGPPQILNVATLGGSLLQRPQCLYFRGPSMCWLKGGEDCPARDGENQNHGIFEDSPCVAVHPSDIATVLLALQAALHVESASGRKVWPIGKFLRPPFPEYRDETSLDARELITVVQLPRAPAGLRSVYLKETEANGSAFALIGVALAAIVDRHRLRDVRLALGGVATVPRRAFAAEQVLAEGDIDSERIDAGVQAALEGARPLSKNGYKLPLLAETIRRAIVRLFEET
ncbi:MAG: FAD binding domain-containing protein [Dehalococcoidia bacterium]